MGGKWPYGGKIGYGGVNRRLTTPMAGRWGVRGG